MARERYIYLTTDAREAIALMGEECYQPNEEFIRMNGNDFPIQDLEMGLGRAVQESVGLAFNPMSYVAGDLTDQEVDKLIVTLDKQRISYAHVNGKIIKQSQRELI